MRHLLTTALLLAGLLISACGRSARTAAAVPAMPRGPSIVFAEPGQADLEQVVETLDARLQAAGLGRASVESRDPPQVICRLLATVSVADAQRMAPWLGGRGELEFRIVSEDSRSEAEKRAKFEERYRLPVGYGWLPSAAGGPDLLVEIPEQEAEAELARATGEGASPERIDALREALAEIVERDVFSGSDVAEADVRQQGPESMVFFAMADDRREAFESFTKRNLKRQLAIVLDDRVITAPVIQSPLPGDGVISGGGGAGFHEEEAAVLAAILDEQLPLPVTLELVRIDEPADAAPR